MNIEGPAYLDLQDRILELKVLERGEGEWDEQGKGEEGENMGKKVDESNSSSQLMKLSNRNCAQTPVENFKMGGLASVYPSFC